MKTTKNMIMTDLNRYASKVLRDKYLPTCSHRQANDVEDALRMIEEMYGLTKLSWQDWFILDEEKKGTL